MQVFRVSYDVVRAIKSKHIAPPPSPFSVSSCREFVLGLNLSTKPLDEKIRWAFKLYDGDKDGLIQRTEIKQVRWSVAKATL